RPAADVVEEVLQQVRGIGQYAEAAEGTRATLNGVGGPKNTIQLIDIRIVDIQVQKQLLHIGEQLVGFIKERIEKLTQVHACTHNRFPLHTSVSRCIVSR